MGTRLATGDRDVSRRLFGILLDIEAAYLPPGVNVWRGLYRTVVFQRAGLFDVLTFIIARISTVYTFKNIYLDIFTFYIVNTEVTTTLHK